MRGYINWEKSTLTDLQAKEVLALCEKHRLTNTRPGVTKADWVVEKYQVSPLRALELINEAERVAGENKHS